MGHGGVCVNPVSGHHDFVRSEAVALHYAREHIRVRLSERDVGATSCRVFDAGT